VSSSDEFTGKKGLVRLWTARCYPRDGIAAAWKHEAAVREEVLAFYPGRTGIEHALMAASKRTGRSRVS
jgi:diacylglycerol kinase (ATP)